MQFWTIVEIAYFFGIVCIVCKNSGNSMFVASLQLREHYFPTLLQSKIKILVIYDYLHKFNSQNYPFKKYSFTFLLVSEWTPGINSLRNEDGFTGILILFNAKNSES